MPLQKYKRFIGKLLSTLLPLLLFTVVLSLIYVAGILLKVDNIWQFTIVSVVYFLLYQWAAKTSATII